MSDTNLTTSPVKDNPKNKNIENVSSLYFDSDALIDTGIQLRRINHNGKRNYFTVTSENHIDRIYTSVTTFTKAVLPTNDYLLKWMKNKSEEEQANILKSSATYGTLMDIFCNELLINKEVKDFDKRIMQFTLREGLYYINYDLWAETLKKDVLAFAKWVTEYEVKPIMVSSPLKSDVLGLAGTMDLYCEMNNRLPTKTIKPHRIKAIVDYKAKIGDMSLKSDRNSFYESECMQLYIYGLLLLENYPDLVIDSFYNFSPKNWRTNPDYNLLKWDERAELSKVTQKFQNHLENYWIDNKDKENNVMVFEDEIKLADFEQSYESISLVEYVNRNLVKEEVK